MNRWIKLVKSKKGMTKGSKKSRIYLTLLEKERKVSELNDIFGNMDGFSKNYPIELAGEMIKEGTLSDRWEERYHYVEADLDVFRDFLIRYTDASPADADGAMEKVRKLSPLLRKLGTADVGRANAVLDIQLCAIGWKYFFKDASLQNVKEEAKREIRQGIKGFEEPAEAYLTHILAPSLEETVLPLLDRLQYFPKAPKNMSISGVSKDWMISQYPLFLQGIVFLIRELGRSLMKSYFP